MSRYWIRDRIHRTPWARRLYMRRARGRGRRLVRDGALREGLANLLHAWKHAWPDAPWPGAGTEIDAVLQAACRGGGASLRPVAENELWRSWQRHPDAEALRRTFASYLPEDRVRMRSPRPDAPPQRQGDLLVLKRHDAVTGELGVLLVTYNMGVERLSALYDLAALAGRYIVVLEPSTWGYHDIAFLSYLGADLDVVVQAQNREDHDFVAGLDSNLVPVRLGAGDWVDPRLFDPKPREDRNGDVVMVGAWDPLKHHDVLFAAIKQLREGGRPVSLTLIGYDMDWTVADVKRVAARHGVTEGVRYLDRVPYAEVAETLADAKVGVLLSRREGANRGIYECWMADTPTIVYRHHRGVNLDQITPANGRLAADHEVADAIAFVLDHPETFEPRTWALTNTGTDVATARLNEVLREIAARRGRPWTRDAVRHTYAGYYDDGERQAMGPAWDELAGYLMPVELAAPTEASASDRA